MMPSGVERPRGHSPVVDYEDRPDVKRREHPAPLGLRPVHPRKDWAKRKDQRDLRSWRNAVAARRKLPGLGADRRRRAGGAGGAGAADEVGEHRLLLRGQVGQRAADRAGGEAAQADAGLDRRDGIAGLAVAEVHERVEEVVEEPGHRRRSPARMASKKASDRSGTKLKTAEE